MKKLNVDDWYDLLLVANDRLDPEHIRVWFIPVSFYSGLMMLFIVLGYFSNANNTFWNVILFIDVIIFIINIILIFYYGNLKCMYKFQRLQSVFLCINGTKLSIDGVITAFFFIYINPEASELMTYGIVAFIVGMALTILMTIRGFNRVRKGYLRKDGKGLYNFTGKYERLSYGAGFGFSVIMLVSVLYRSISNAKIQNVIFLCLALFMQYVMALALPEFYLLTYCKFKYKEFIVEMSQLNKDKLERKIQAKLNKPKRMAEEKVRKQKIKEHEIILMKKKKKNDKRGKKEKKRS